MSQELTHLHARTLLGKDLFGAKGTEKILFKDFFVAFGGEMALENYGFEL